VASETTGISPVPFNISLFEVHPGKRFHAVQALKLKLTFKKATTGGNYFQIVSTLSLTTTDGLASFYPINRNVKVVPASFTLITSRTSPLAPQPIAA
jgi:hypothetical protein